MKVTARGAAALAATLAAAGSLVLGAESAAATTTLRPTSDATLIDFDLDGSGDDVFDGLGSIIVGFDAHFGDGEYRGAYAFDLGALPVCSDIDVTLRLVLAGTAFADPDPIATLHASGGDGALTAADFSKGAFVAELSPTHAPTYPVSLVDVSGAVHAAQAAGTTHLTLFVRPNPAASGARAAFLFSSNEIVDAFGFAPTVLEARCVGPQISVPPDFAVDAAGPGGAAVAFSATAVGDAGPVPAACSPASGDTFPIGTTTVTCSAVDAAGHTSSSSFRVHVRGAFEQSLGLGAAVAGLPPGTSLVDKVTLVQDALRSGDTAAACELLQAFVRQVAAQSGRLLDEGAAAVLTVLAERIRAVAAC